MNRNDLIKLAEQKEHNCCGTCKHWANGLCHHSKFKLQRTSDHYACEHYQDTIPDDIDLDMDIQYTGVIKEV